MPLQKKEERMSTKVIISYRLREGRTREEYYKWSRELDQPVASRQPGVLGYEIYDITGSGTDEEPWCDIIEVIEAESWEAWAKVNSYEEMHPVVESWRKLCIPESVRVIYG